ncbi:hypothetical protein, conserved [Trypanosoma brucei brucei TREU927]|uniref:Uncharacterized protein n=1 Tax=Trypanosoma brucei brucei (strain 927/4 GUTat10.1) TaxID=185431 RepID=Q580C5_TRYB2|nr:hypothetical protein, conserved [Trypanosoma brucei brucei TREU927]AAX80914.1 hypothetical protein, conserved [Trypanosoma brucei]AAZ10688.1 hypothetical protein, conserved [Trypanosoma brucei brucei TREU927]
MTSRRVVNVAAGATRNRQHYLKLLRDCARELPQARMSTSEGATVTRVEEGSKLLATPRAKFLEANLSLPEGWVESSTTSLQKSLEGVVPREKIVENDLFRCALIHPSYVRSRSVRAAVAMPIELTLTGSSTLRLLKQVADAHNLKGYLGSEEIANVPRKLGVIDLVLFDGTMFEGAGWKERGEPPEEVCMAAATALCGVVTLSEGAHSAAVLLDRIRGLNPL